MYYPAFKYDVKIYKDEEVVFHSEVKNLVTTSGKAFVANVMFGNKFTIPTWYMLLMGTSATPAVTMTYSAPGFTEFVAYTESTRPAVTFAVDGVGGASNLAARSVFTVNAATAVQVYGFALAGNAYGSSAAVATKGDTSTSQTTLYSCATLSVPGYVVAGNVISIGVTMSQA